MKGRRPLAAIAHFVLLAGLLVSLTAAAPTASAAAAPQGPVYVVTYFEVAPASAPQTGQSLRQFAGEARAAPGNIEYTALREIGRIGRFAIVEMWRDRAAFEAHDQARRALADKLQPVFLSPFDARRFYALSVAPTPTPNLADAMVVLTHVDVFPAGKEQAAAMVKELAEKCRGDDGSRRFDAVIQDGRPNHFHLIEVWQGAAAREAHAMATHTRQFRTQLVPLEGSLYDERLFEIVR
jgi:quinol monooxygenase YgiN